MGADMLLAVVTSHNRTEEDIRASIAALSTERAIEIFSGAEGWDYDEAYPEEDTNVLEFVQSRLVYALGAINGSREVTSIDVNGTFLWVTGGLSWGDSPTECFDAFNMAEESGLF